MRGGEEGEDMSNREHSESRMTCNSTLHWSVVGLSSVMFIFLAHMCRSAAMA
jgi:hypothetical protein